MVAYYNEIDDFAAQWLRNLIAAGRISPGDVDTRSIEDVAPDDLRGYTQCHFFAGIGVWSYALRQAGWPDERPVWTGSCPCQPFSAAGKGSGFADERHLWPAWFHLIGQCRPPVVFGEQVASKDGLGWLDLVSTDLESADYALGASDLCAAGVGAPHIRQRLWFIAEDRLSDAKSGGGRTRLRDCKPLEQRRNFTANSERAFRLGDADNKRLEGWSSAKCGRERKIGQAVTCSASGRSSPIEGQWGDADWLFCRDGKWRPVEPGTFPLAHGIAGRVGRLRAYGNAIVAQAAQAVIEAYQLTAIDDLL